MRIVVEVNGGVVVNIYANSTSADVTVVDFDNAKATSQEAVAEATQMIEQAERELHRIY